MSASLAAGNLDEAPQDAAIVLLVLRAADRDDPAARFAFRQLCLDTCRVCSWAMLTASACRCVRSTQYHSNVPRWTRVPIHDVDLAARPGPSWLAVLLVEHDEVGVVADGDRALAGEPSSLAGSTVNAGSAASSARPRAKRLAQGLEQCAGRSRRPCASRDRRRRSTAGNRRRRS